MTLQDLLAEMTLDDLVVSIFYRSKLPNIPSGKAFLHKFFFNLTNHPNLPKEISDVLSDVSFGAGEIYPFSRRLESSLIRLQIAGLISAMNPDYRQYNIDNNQKEKIKDIFEQFDENEKKNIGYIAEEFKAEVATISWKISECQVQV